MLPQRSLCLPRAVAVLATLWFATVLTTSAQQPNEQKPVPDAALQGKAELTLIRLYANQFKAAQTDKAAARELAQELLAQGKATRDDYKLRFVALKLASELAAKVGDNALALEAINELAASFRIDTLNLKTDIYAQAEKTLADKNDALALTEIVLNLMDDAFAVDNFATAVKLLDIAKKAALKGKVLNVAAQVEKRGLELLEAVKAFKAMQPLLEKAGKDDQATLIVGRYYCFINGNYAKGLPLLAKCTDKTLKDLANLDLGNPKEPYAQALIADIWNEVGQREKGLVQRQIYRRASHWYQVALPGLEGLTRVRVQRELDDLGKQFPLVTVHTPPVPVGAEITAEVRLIAGVPLVVAQVLVASPDGKWILQANSSTPFGGGDSSVSVWDIGTGQKVKNFGTVNDEAIYSLALSPDKKYVLTGSGNLKGGVGALRLWDMKSGQQVRQFAGHNGSVRGVFFLPDGKRILSGCDDGSLRIFDLNKGEVLKTLNTNQSIYTMAISKDGRRAICGGSDAHVIIWDLQTGQKVRQFEHPRLVRNVALTPDGKLAVSNSTLGGGVKIWDVESGKELRTLPAIATSLWMAVSPDGRRVYVVSSLAKKAKGGFNAPNNSIQVFDLHTGQELRQLTGHTGAVRGLTASPDGRWLVSVGIDGMRVWGAK